jgi:hypothetical protein
MSEVAYEWIAPSRSADNIRDAHADFIEVAAWYANMWGDNALMEKISDAVKKAYTANKDMLIDGRGLLLRFRVEKVSHADTPFSAKRLIGDGYIDMGVAITPEHALFAYMTEPQLLQSETAGWEFDELASPYIWVSNDATGSAISSVVPQGVAGDLLDRMQSDYDNLFADSYTGLVDMGFASVMQAADAAKEDAKNLANRAEIEAISQELLDSHKRVNEINRDLENALREVERAGYALQQLKTLQGIISIAQMTVDFARELDVKPEELSKDMTPEMPEIMKYDLLYSRVQTLKNGKLQTAETLVLSFNANASRFNASKNKFWTDYMKNDKSSRPPNVPQRRKVP